ncbi:DUF4175 family protein [Cognatitamlana onchidii]|uniref:DUF4175 family protein n=1 Tax=Cognatitamlana onchidii TaxID=2562860 RepID=UPI001455E916|nr:DUF4175 family protein [Algibacter onchidii]
MTSFNTIQSKLETFIKRYYANELLKGFILFFAAGTLYFFLTLLIEHVLWLDTVARTVLFWLFIVVEFLLLFKFIFIPLANLFKLKKGIDYKEASKIIGRHFPEVNDKLLNVLQLHELNSESELLLASIEQKSIELSPIPFKLAVNFRSNLGYLKYAAIPVTIWVIIFLTGNTSWFSSSYKRVVDYQTAYEPPAPFAFFIFNEKLEALENKDFKLKVKTVGDVTPESMQIAYNGETYFLQQKNIGEFEYVFTQPKASLNFRLFSNEVNSKPYTLKVIRVPSLLSFEMTLDYPVYTKRKNELLKSTGNAIVPEGTKVGWKVTTKATSDVSICATDTVSMQAIREDYFESSKEVVNDFNYAISTSNKTLKYFESLEFHIDVVKDEYPAIDVVVKKDSLDLQSLYFYGQISDDYGFTGLQMVYYPAGNDKHKEYLNIPISKSNIADFISAFPNGLNITDGVVYQIYFQVFDNDAVNGVKTTKSSVFNYRKRTVEEEQERQLKEQGETIKRLGESLTNFKDQEKRLDEITKTQKEKSSLNFNDKKKLESFLRRQKQQDEMMKNFNKKLSKNLEEFQKENQEKDQFKENLKERIKENEEKLKKDEKMLEEIEKIQDKINKEELIKKLDELAKENRNKERSLEQLLELTKRFYVEKKLEKLAEDLNTLASKQDELSNKSEEENTKKNQDSLNDQFEEFKNRLDKLEEDNKSLKKPINIPRDQLEEQEVKKEQQQASDELEKNEEKQKDGNKENSSGRKNDELKNAKKSQRKAAQKMRKMSQNMQSAMQMQGEEQMQEDLDMLRQILDNLVLFSFDQEALMEQFKAIEANHNKFANYLKKQHDLREHFEHIDDSLFALSLRQPKISEQVNGEISEVFYSIDKSLDLMADNRLYQGISSQQFAITSANNLANLLSDALDSMQENMSMSAGKGGKGDMQLPDIIMSQEQLNEMMKEGMKKANKGKPKDGEGKEEGKGRKEGDEKGKGENTKNGNGTQRNGENGEDFNNEQEGLLFEIYQKQQQLRQALQDRLEKEGKGANGSSLVRQMEQVELELLNKGFSNQTLQKMMRLEHQLLKMENAALQQGEDSSRESKTNRDDFDVNSDGQLPTAKEYFETTEILNKRALPLQQSYRKKVQDYFKQSYD